jgi:hypothetical protein
VLVAAALIVVAMVAGGLFVVLRGGRSYPSSWPEEVQPIAEWVATERDLEFEHPVEVNFLSDEEYSEVATAGGDEESEEQLQQEQDTVAFLRALGFLSGDVDLGEATDTLSDSGTLAYYDPASEEVYVRGTEMTPALQVTLAHELVHVLQDQHFDLERIAELDSGRASVLRAVAEGDATRIEDIYIADELTDEQRTAYEEESSSSEEDVTDELDAKVPGVLSTVFSSPYILGPNLIEVLDELEGLPGIDDALAEPPTEEVLFDPTRMDGEGSDAIEVSASAPGGTEEIDRGEFGPTTWFLLLASRLDAKEALAAVDGWGGDEYVTYRDGDQVCVAIVAEGDTDADTAELADAAAAWAEASPDGTADASQEGGSVRFRSCDPGKDAEAVSGEITPDLLVLPVTRTQIYVQSLAADARPDQAACFAQAVVDAFTVEQLNDPEGAAIQSPEGQRKVLAARNDCMGG